MNRKIYKLGSRHAFDQVAVISKLYSTNVNYTFESFHTFMCDRSLKKEQHQEKYIIHNIIKNA